MASVEVNLSQADMERLGKIAAEKGLSIGEMLSVFLQEVGVICGVSNGKAAAPSSERMHQENESEVADHA